MNNYPQLQKSLHR